MFKVTGPLAKASVELKTTTGEKSTVRAIDPGNTVVTDDVAKETVEIKKAIATYVKALATKKEAEAEAAKAADVIRFYTGEVRDENAIQGDYQKTYRLLGEITKGTQLAVDVSQADRSSLTKGTKIEDAKKELGKNLFAATFELETFIKIKDSVMKNAALRKELSKKLFDALGQEGIKTYFEKEEEWVVLSGTEKAQYKLTPAERTLLLKFVTLYADSVKDTSTKI